MTLSGDPDSDTAGHLADHLRAHPGWRHIDGTHLIAKHIATIPYATGWPDGQEMERLMDAPESAEHDHRGHHEPVPGTWFEPSMPVVRTGRLKHGLIYGTVKVRGGQDQHLRAPAGALVEWCGEQTEHEPILRGDTLERVPLLWVYLPGYSPAPIGVPEHGVEWDA